MLGTRHEENVMKILIRNDFRWKPINLHKLKENLGINFGIFSKNVTHAIKVIVLRVLLFIHWCNYIYLIYALRTALMQVG